MTTDRHPAPALRLPTLRDVIAPLFRHKRAGIAAATAVFLGAAGFALTRSTQYQAEMKILVKRERVDPLVSGDPLVRPQARTDVTEDDLNSEVELLRSRDLLEDVAVAAQLSTRTARHDEEDSLARVVQQLQSDLKINAIRKTTFIKVTYRADNAARARRVLGELARLYPEKHLALHRTPGAFEFFAAQAEQFHAVLGEAEARLKEFGRRQHVVSADVEKQNTLQRLAEFEAALQQARGAIAANTRRVTELEAEIALTPPRQTTQIRTSENADFISELKSRILSLEIKHGEMLRKFSPTYLPVVEIEEELEQARAALARTEQAPFTEETTDQNTTYQWLHSELARVKTERAALQGQAAAVADSVAVYREKARQLDEQGMAQQDLTRAMKSAEANYLLYRGKQEEARISDALDRTRILNVAIAEAPNVPQQPSKARTFWLLALSAVAGLLIGAATTYVLDHFSPYFHTPEDVATTLDIPILASVPVRHVPQL